MEHDFWSLLKNNKFNAGEVKCLMKQLLEGIAYLHENKIIHRDLKCGNLLLNNKGCLKIADFGLARKFSTETRKSHNVVTFWYRAPELLLGTQDYDDKIDIWSIGCIFAEFLTGYILFKGKKIKDQLQCIYEKLGNPLPKWRKVNQTKLWKEMKPTRKYEPALRHFIQKYNKRVDESTLSLLERLLEYDPKKRISAKDALKHEYFFQHPQLYRKEDIKRFKGEYHELNSKVTPKFNISEKAVMKDYKKIQTLEILKELHRKHEEKLREAAKNKKKFLHKNSFDSDMMDPQFSSEGEPASFLRNSRNLDHYSKCDHHKQLTENKVASFEEEAYFSDENDQMAQKKGASRKSVDSKEDFFVKEHRAANGLAFEDSRRRDNQASKDCFDLDLDWIN